jgi:TRAP transporter 4TM/12TM fusion protein
VSRVFCFLLSALALYWVLFVVSPQVYRPLMLLVGVWATFRVKPTAGRWGPAIDTVWVVAALFSLGWPLAAGDPFLYRAANPTPGDLAAGVLAMVVIAEAARRTTGWILPIAAAAFVGYALAGPWLGAIGLGGIAHRGYDVTRLVGNLFMTLEGIYGVALDVAVTYIILFAMYGALLEHSGAGRFFIDFALRLSSRGDPAKAAGRAVTLGGFLLGTVSGSGVATTVTLGSVAWPVLRRVGYPADTAGAMLAASGIGALLSPPTLGAAAFLIAEYLQISYLQVLVMATVPTVLYYLSILLMIEGQRPGTAGTAGTRNALSLANDRDDSVTMAAGSSDRVEYLHFLSLVLVAALMVWGLTPFRAVFWSMVAAVVISLVMPRESRLTPKRLGAALADGGADVLPVLATTAVAGIIVGVVLLTGIGLKAAGLIVGLAGGSVMGTVLLAAGAVWLLGLAVPVTASYIVSAVMVVPALTQVGVAPVAAHMFIFYYAVLSEVSPPTALAPFAAAAITGGRPFRTMLLTWKYALPAFVVPLAFTVDPRGLALLLQEDWGSIALATGTAVAGIVALAAAIGGWGFSGRSQAARVAMGVTGAFLLHPAPAADAAGAVVGALAVLLSLTRPGGSPP